METNFVADTSMSSHRTHTHTRLPNLTGEAALDPLLSFQGLNLPP